jgi:hypothetical protein
MAQLSYRRHRFPASIIHHAVWLYLRFTLSYRAGQLPSHPSPASVDLGFAFADILGLIRQN